MAITPHGHRLVDIHQGCQQAEWQLECRMIAIEHNKQSCSYRPSRHTPNSRRLRVVKDTAECLPGILKGIDLLLPALRFKVDFRANPRDFSVEHRINRLTIGAVEREVSHADERSATEPGIERLEYCRPLPLTRKRLAIAFREAFRGCLSVKQQSP